MRKTVLFFVLFLREAVHKTVLFFVLFLREAVRKTVLFFLLFLRNALSRWLSLLSVVERARMVSPFPFVFSWSNRANWLKTSLASSLSRLVPTCAHDMLNQVALELRCAHPWYWATGLFVY